MQIVKKSYLVLVFVLFIGLNALQAQVKIACVGNSITFGSGIENREVNSYPAQMQKILGKGFEVQNFGVSGATMLKSGDKPYWKQDKFNEAKDFNPDIVIIKLGTNDSKPQNWPYEAEYKNDYKAMIETFRSLPSKPQVIICLPVPVFETRWGIREQIVTREVLPYVLEVSKEAEVKVIDLYTPFINQPQYFPDKIHPNAEGAAIMAGIISSFLKENEYIE